MGDYQDTFHRIFSHCGLSEPVIDTCMNIASKHDISKKTSDEIKKIEHVRSTEKNKWKEEFEKEHKDLFIEKFGDILIKLGYEKDNNW